MDYETLENRYLGEVKFLLRLVGTWPRQGKLYKYSLRLFIFIVTTLSNIGQISNVVVFFSMNTLTDQMLFLMIGFGMYIKQYNYVFNEEELEILLDGIVRDRMGRSQDELEIMEVYHKRVIILANIHKVAIVMTFILFLMMPAMPFMLDVVQPLNVSRERMFTYPVYFFVDNQEYYYYILVFDLVCLPVSCILYGACDITLIHIIQHGCALLAVSGYRFKHAMDGANFVNEKATDGTIEESYAKVVRAIVAHKKANEYMKMIDRCHVHYLGIVMIMITVALTVSLVQVSTMKPGVSLVTYSVFTMAQLVHVLFITILGQFTLDGYNENFQQIYDAQWYNGSTKIQTLYLFVLQKCLTPQKLTCAGMVALDLDIFVQILKASFSYYTVLKSA